MDLDKLEKTINESFEIKEKVGPKSDLAPTKQLSSMITGPAWSGSRTPPIPAPPEIWQFFPTWAHEPTDAQVSIIVPSST